MTALTKNKARTLIRAIGMRCGPNDGCKLLTSTSSPTLLRQIPTDSHDACTFSPSTKLIVFNFSERCRRQLVSYNVLPNAEGVGLGERPFILWQSVVRRRGIPSAVLQTSSIPLGFDTIVLGYCGLRSILPPSKKLTFVLDQPTDDCDNILCSD